MAQRTTLLMCCCMQQDVPERQVAVAALVRNGFACRANADQAPSRRTLQQALNSAGFALTGVGRGPSRGTAEAVTLLLLRHSWS